MAKKTLHDQFVAALINLGQCIVKRNKRTVMTTNRRDVETGKPMFYYIGKSGALRIGVSSTHSFAVSAKSRDSLLDSVVWKPRKGWQPKSDLLDDL